MRRAAIVTGRVLVAIYAAICTLFFFIQRSIIFHPVPASGDASATTFEVPGAVLRIATRPHDGPRAILYFGGNAEDVSWAAADLAAVFPDRAIYAPHYRGASRSTRRRSRRPGVHRPRGTSSCSSMTTATRSNRRLTTCR